mgnify:CR=1 FL=1
MPQTSYLWNYVYKNQQNSDNPQTLPPMNKNDSTASVLIGQYSGISQNKKIICTSSIPNW